LALDDEAWHFGRMSDDLSLAAEFPATDREDWRKLVEAALKGRSFDKLVSKTYDGFAVEPLYERATHAEPVLGRAPGRPWRILQRIDHPDPAAANAQALEDLENAATGLTLVFTGSLNANGFGLSANPDAIERTLRDVQLDAGIAIDFNVSPETRAATGVVASLVKARGLKPAQVDFRPSLNPIGGFAAAGKSAAGWGEVAKTFAATIKDFAAAGFRGPFAAADGRVIHNAGGSEAQELAFAIASAIDYLRALEVAGVPLDAARRAISFRLAADADEFLTIAKFRAVRKLWARVEGACGLTPQPGIVAAETAWRMMTQRDPFVNMLRTTIAVSAAALGGADTIAALPHTAALGLPDAFARRVIRNTQLILLEESHLAKVADPAAGSGAIEALTSKLCDAAWAIVQSIEAAGGTWRCLEQGTIQQQVADVRREREKAVARRKDALTGTTDYPLLQEASARVLAPASRPKQTPDAALPSIRMAEPFEALRDKSDALLARTGARPKVFLANLGKLSDFNARATFAKNFYEAGGIEAVTNDGFKSLDEMVSAFKASGAKLACLCSSDKVYEAQAADAAKALKQPGAIVHLAGRPGEHEAAWNTAGVSTYIYVGCDVLSTLRAAHDMIAKP
jgi:methylmalonyl-CoA mutase